MWLYGLKQIISITFYLFILYLTNISNCSLSENIFIINLGSIKQIAYYKRTLIIIEMVIRITNWTIKVHFFSHSCPSKLHFHDQIVPKRFTLFQYRIYESRRALFLRERKPNRGACLACQLEFARLIKWNVGLLGHW